MQLAEAFKLNEDGYALIQRLVSRRMELDLEEERAELGVILAKQKVIEHKSGFFNSINKYQKEHSAARLQERVVKKETWRQRWDRQNIDTLPSALQHCPIEELIDKHRDTVTGRVQLYLILQEVVHTPIYYALDDFEEAGEEERFERHIEEFSQLCALKGITNTIHRETKAYFKEIHRDSANILKLDVGGSGILSAIAGGASGKLLSELPQEAIALNVVKVVNLINYLNSNDNPDRASTDDILAEARTLFLDFKVAAERKVVFEAMHKSEKESMQLLDILDVGLRRIVKNG